MIFCNIKITYQQFVRLECVFEMLRTLAVLCIRNTDKQMDTKKQKQNQINIELPEEIAEGTYSNLAIISHSHSEFIIDFVRLVPNVPKAKVKSRMILTPSHAKRLMKALNDNINKYENQFGIIDEAALPAFPNMNFNTPKAQA